MLSITIKASRKDQGITALICTRLPYSKWSTFPVKECKILPGTFELRKRILSSKEQSSSGKKLNASCKKQLEFGYVKGITEIYFFI